MGIMPFAMDKKSEITKAMEGCPAVTGAVFLSFVFVVDLLLGKRRDDNPDNNKLPAFSCI